MRVNILLQNSKLFQFGKHEHYQKGEKNSKNLGKAVDR